jgi:hypothetical protein
MEIAGNAKDAEAWQKDKKERDDAYRDVYRTQTRRPAGRRRRPRNWRRFPARERGGGDALRSERRAGRANG